MRLGGNDSIEVDTSLGLGGGDLNLTAESITVSAGTSVTGAGAVNLLAVADDSTTSSHASRTASIEVQGNITASGKVTIDASVNNVVSDTTSAATSSLSETLASTATAEVGGSAVITGNAVEIHATNTVNVTESATQSITGTNTVNVTNVTRADVTGTAQVVTNSAPGTVSIQALDNTTVTSTLTQPGTATLPTPFNFNLLSSSVTLSRDTQAYVNSTPTSPAQAIQSAGAVVIHAENTGSVQGTAASDFVGLVTNTSQEDARSYIDGSVVNGTGVEVSALSNTSYGASGKVAVNHVTGLNADPTLQGTRANIHGGTVTSGAGGIDVKATDTSQATAESTRLAITLDDLTSSVSIGVASARNELDRPTEASITGGADVEATGGNLTVEAKNALHDSAKADASSISATPSYAGVLSVSLGGILATNAILGGVVATVTGSTVKTITSGTLKVDAGRLGD